MPGSLSLRYKVPLRVGGLILFVGLAVATALLFGAYQVFKRDLLLSSENMGRILSRSLTPTLLHDDTWKAYEIINAPFSIDAEEGSLQAELIIVLDADDQVYVSTNPTQYPMLTDPTLNDPEIGALISAMPKESPMQQYSIEDPGFERLYVVTAIASDGIRLGTLLMGYSKEIFINRFTTIAHIALGTTLLIMLLLLPVGAYWGHRIAAPLVRLSNCMSKVGSELPEMSECDIQTSDDEIGQLGRQFYAMVEELREKAALEQEMIVAERLAAIGRFTAGVAHEINNPLGGLLNATNTLRRHGNNDPLTQKTIQLLDRGLRQIKNTVAALLVEAAPTTHPLSRQDIEDTRTLVQQEAAKKRAVIHWCNDIDTDVPLPSTLIRQILINLLLNAIEAVPEKGTVACSVQIEGNFVMIHVTNEGGQIDGDTLNHLFEPFASGKREGRGLGLWVTFQIVDRLGGMIEVSSDVSNTTFSVRLPLYAEAA